MPTFLSSINTQLNAAGLKPVQFPPKPSHPLQGLPTRADALKGLYKALKASKKDDPFTDPAVIAAGVAVDTLGRHGALEQVAKQEHEKAMLEAWSAQESNVYAELFEAIAETLAVLNRDDVRTVARTYMTRPNDMSNIVGPNLAVAGEAAAAFQRLQSLRQAWQHIRNARRVHGGALQPISDYVFLDLGVGTFDGLLEAQGSGVSAAGTVPLLWTAVRIGVVLSLTDDVKANPDLGRQRWHDLRAEHGKHFVSVGKLRGTNPAKPGSPLISSPGGVRRM